MATAPLANLPVLRDDNPYYNGQVATFPDGSQALDPGPLVYTKSPNDKYYTLGQGDTLDNIAGQDGAYGNSKYWWVIAKVNNVFDPFSLTAGDTMVIPDKDILDVNNL